MIGKSSLILVGLAAAAGAVLFETSFKVQGLEEELAKINRQIVAEHDAIQVLHAEWSLLNDPSRLERLSRAHLPLRPAEARQYAELSTVPVRKAADPADALVAGMPGAEQVVAGPLLPKIKPATSGRTQPQPAPATDNMGVLIARLGATR